MSLYDALGVRASATKTGCDDDVMTVEKECASVSGMERAMND